MASTKKKTVKELSDIIEILEKRIKHLEEDDKVAKHCECNHDSEKNEAMDKVRKLEENLSKTYSKIESMENEIMAVKEETKVDNFKCRKCGSKFSNRKYLDEHIKTNHQRKKKCNNCEDSFAESWKYEKHVKQHGKEKEFQCETCEQTFYTEWRLSKHQESHRVDDKKYCHYFNNLKKCPFEEFGCKFEHNESEICRFQERCRNALCQFRHNRVAEESMESWKCDQTNWMGEKCEFESCVEMRLRNHLLAEHEIGVYFKCDDCDFTEKDRGKLIEHIKNKHGQIYLTCGGNCSDRMYEENSFTCGQCDTFLCIICSRSDISENSALDPGLSYCSACAKE